MIGNLIRANPAAYGFTNAGACPLTCVGNPTLQNQYLFYVDALHLTSHGFAVLGEYIVNRLEAPLTLAAQGELGMSATQGFIATLFGRLDLFNESSAIVGSPYLAYAPVRKGPIVDARPAPVPSPLSVYILANGGLGHRSSTPSANGYDFESVGGTIGAEYRIGGNALLGAAFNYANPNARLTNSAGRTNSDAYQFGLYGAWTNAHFFAQAFGIAGFQSYQNTRPGIVDMLRSRAEGANFAAGGKVGYLFDVGAMRIGPIAGLTYARSQINPFTETGDPVLVLNVGRQNVEALVGSAGAQIRYPFLVGGRAITPFLNLTAEEDFRGNGRIIQFGAVSAPLIINTWDIPSGSRRPYGRVAGGFQADVYPNVAITATATRTFGRSGGDDFFGSGGIKVAF
jgi:outer membrane autotransporter protein